MDLYRLLRGAISNRQPAMFFKPQDTSLVMQKLRPARELLKKARAPHGVDTGELSVSKSLKTMVDSMDFC